MTCEANAFGAFVVFRGQPPSQPPDVQLQSRWLQLCTLSCSTSCGIAHRRTKAETITTPPTNTAVVRMTKALLQGLAGRADRMSSITLKQARGPSFLAKINQG